MRNPPFNEARGAAALTSIPPFDFDQVVMRVFPLKARLDRLTSCIDRLLNVVPPEVAVFRPSLPYVYFMTINYGRMESEVANAGWTSQHEIGFAVPLDWYRKEGDALVYHDMATVFPFIFVDDVTSQVTGREVYGWPKVQGWLAPRVDSWATSPRDPREVVCLRSTVMREGVAGEREQARIVLEVLQDPPASIARLRPVADNPLSPIVAIPKAFTTSLQLAMDAVQVLAPTPLGGADPATLPPPWAEKLGAAYRRFVPWQSPRFDCVNLKQFRDVDDPTEACYQALVTSEMTIRRVNDGGLLGEEFLAQGDVTGGFTIRIHGHSVLPVVEALGLEVASTQQERDVRVSILEPVLPTWSSVDMRYGAGDVACWRTTDSPWHVPSEPAETPGGEAPPADADVPETILAAAAPADFNLAHGAGELDSEPEDVLTDVVVRVLPLLASAKVLKTFCEAYLNDPESEYRFEPIGSYVYLVLQNHGGEDDGAEGPDLPLRDVRFCFPVTWWRGKELVSLSLVTPYAFMNSQRKAETARELFGLPAMLADIEGPRESWIGSEEPPATSKLLEMKAQVLTNLDVGERSSRKTVVEIVRGTPAAAGALRWQQVAATWGQRLLQEIHRKERMRKGRAGAVTSGMALALEILANERQVLDVTLKQFRDAGRPSDACYQALVVSGMAIDRLWDLREIEQSLHVRLHAHASLPIQKTLGLRIKLTEDTRHGLVHVLEPLRPFYLRADIRVRRGRVLAWRAGETKWTYPESSATGYFSDPCCVRVGDGLVSDLVAARGAARDERPPWRDVVKATRGWWRELQAGARQGERTLDLQDARRIFSPLPGGEPIDPHAIIESILSAEWHHQGDARWYRRAFRGEAVEQKPDTCVRRDSVGTESDALFPVPRGSRAFRSGHADAAGWYPTAGEGSADEK